MIKLHKLKGEEFLLNSELIVSVEACPDTIITLKDETKYIVSDSIDEIYDKIVKFKADILLKYRQELKKINNTK